MQDKNMLEEAATKYPAPDAAVKGAFVSGMAAYHALVAEADADLKKAGIFPIVHGVRSLALRNHVPVSGTVPRLAALVAAGRLPAAMATDLTDSLHFLMALKLKAGLDEIDMGRGVSGAVPTDRLSSLERDLLKDAFAAVKRFKVLVRHQFHLEA